MTCWQPIETLKTREPHKQYLVAMKDGDVQLVFWDRDNRVWIPKADTDDETLDESDIALWFDYPAPQVSKESLGAQ